MTVTQAVKYFHFMLSKGHWKQTEKSKEAFNILVEFVEEKNKQQFNENQLFGKLFIAFYGELLRFYECTIFDREPQKAISKILDTPIEHLIEKFIDKHQDMGYVLQVPKEQRYEPKKFRRPQDLDYEFKFIDKMDYQEAEDNLTAMINNALNTFN
tara:strand:+ start:242 stop:706 length:465 start_codon:yes stop_codon:yes gene_type:complete